MPTIDVGPAVRSVTSFGLALEALVDIAEALKTAAGTKAQANPSARLTEEAQGFEQSDVQRRLDAELGLIQQKRGELQKVLGGVLGEASSPALLDGYLKIRADLVEFEKAARAGVLDTNESTEAIGALRRQLAERREKLGMTGTNEASDIEGGSVLKTSRWARLERAARGGIEAVGTAAQAVAGQGAGIAEGLMGLARSLPIAGGLFGLMLWGVQEKDRLAAQLGEVSNLAVAAGGDAHDRGVAYMASFQERAQNFYGISRKEIQSNIKTFVNAGLTFSDIFAAEDKTLGEVGHNAVNLSVGLDRHFELAAGTTAKASTKLVTEYGLGLGDALQTMEKVEFAASRAGFSVGGFVTWTMQATAQVRGLGVSLGDVAGAAVALSRRYKEQGLSATSAGKAAQEGLGEALGTMGKMGLGREIWAAESLGLGEGLEGRQKLKEGLTQGRKDMLRSMTMLLRDDAMKQAMGNETHARFFLERQGHSHEGARAIIELGKEFDKGVQIEQLSATDKKRLRGAYVEESQKVSNIQKGIKETLAGMAKMGEGFLAMFTNFAAIAIVGMKTLPILVAGSDADKEEVFKQFQTYGRGIAAGWAQVMTGGSEAIRGVAQVMGPILEPMKKAIEWQYTTNQPSAFDTALPPTQEGSEALMQGVWGTLLGRPLTAADKQVLFPAGMSPEEAERLALTPEGREELVRRKKADLENEKTKKAQANGSAGSGSGPTAKTPKPGAAAPDTWVLPGVGAVQSRLGPGLGSFGRKKGVYLPDEPPKFEVTTHWAPGADPKKPLTVEVQIKK